MQREREQRRDIETLASEFGCRFDWEHTRKGHVRVVFHHGSQHVAVVMAKGHGGDWRGRQNNLARLRRQLRGLQNESAALAGGAAGSSCPAV